MDIRSINRERWNKQVEQGNPWTVPVSRQVIEDARQGKWQVLLTERKPVPRSWFPKSFTGLDLLGLACGGGQQGPIFAALGAKVTILDNSPRQLERDREVAQREGLSITTVEGDMGDLSMFADNSLDLVFNPVSVCFVPEVRPIWREAYRVLKPGGTLLTGFCNPVLYIFNYQKMEQGLFEVQYKLPFDSRKLSEEELKVEFGENEPLEFSHMLEDLVGGQLDAGFMLVGMYEDRTKGPIEDIMPMYIATRARKMV